jgi:phosphate transport system substrate-binding protein
MGLADGCGLWEIIMKFRAGVALAVSVTVFSTMVASPAWSETVRIGGTGAATELMRELGAAYAKKVKTEFEIVPSLGSSGAIGALADGVLDIAVSARPLKPEEQAKGLKTVSVLRTPFVIATSHPAPKGLRSSDIALAYSSNTATWNDGIAMRVILRPKSESDTALISTMFPGMTAAVAAAQQRQDVPVAATDQDNAGLAERTSGSVIGSSLVQIMLEKRALRLVAIDGVSPTLAALEAGQYPYTKSLYVVVADKMSEVTAQFMAWLQSPDGLRQLRALHVLGGK